jgi:hypothetical protein
MMVCTDAAITIDASPVLDLTAFDLTISNGINLAKVVGSPYSPDVYEGAFTITGTLSALRSSAARQSAYLAGTTFALVLTFSVPGSASTLAFTLPEPAHDRLLAALGQRRSRRGDDPRHGRRGRVGRDDLHHPRPVIHDPPEA